jgi:HEPN domain-containing protein
LSQQGWTAADRVRLHLPRKDRGAPEGHPMGQLLRDMPPHILVRKYDRDEGVIVVLHFYFDGKITGFTNNEAYGVTFLKKLLLECPPSFHGEPELSIDCEWSTDENLRAMFLGLLHGALGWDSHHQIPPILIQSLEEAYKSLEIANYRSCVVMCRRALEGLLKFAFPRLLKKQPVDAKGKAMMLNDMTVAFKNEKPAPIPQHLLNIVDAVRLIGNVPGAHAAEIPGYRFTRSDAEFALAAANHFIDTYFSKIDTEVGAYYTLIIDFGAEADETKSGATTPPSP